MNPRQVLSLLAILVLGLGVFLWVVFDRDDSGNDLTDLDEDNSFHLASEKELLLWEADHIATIVELRLTPVLFSSVLEKKKTQLDRLLSDSAVFSIAPRKPSPGFDPNASQTWGNDSGIVKKTVSRDKFLTYLTNLYRDIEDIKSSDNKFKFQLMSVEKIDGFPNRWRIGFRFTVNGKGVDGLLHHAPSEHLIELDIGVEKEIADVPGIVRWSVNENDHYRTAKFFFKEFSKQYNLTEVTLLDDWVDQALLNQQRKKGEKLKDEEIKMIYSQNSLVDLDSDGFPDLIVATPNGVPMLFKNNSDGGFQNITQQSGLKNWNTPEGTNKNLCAWIDYNNDGLPDLLLGNLFFRNDGNGRFTDITIESGITIDHGCSGAIVADYDCDGFQDLYLIYASSDSPFFERESWVTTSKIYQRNVLFHNEGNGKFLDVSLVSHSDGGKSSTRSAAWLHYNDDIYPDLVLVNYLDESFVLINDGKKGTFHRLGSETELSAYGFNTGVSVGDLDNDGISEIFINGCYSPQGIRQIGLLAPDDYPKGYHQRLSRMVNGNFLFKRNSAEGSNSDWAKKWHVDDNGLGFGSTTIDVQNDGWLDLYSTAGMKSYNRFEMDGSANWFKAIFIAPELQNCKIHPPKSIEEKFDLNLGEFWLERASSIPAYRKNLFAFQPNRFFLNDRGKNFVDASFASNADIDSDSRSAIAADIDRDGATDLLVSSIGGGPLRLFLNQLPQQNRIRLELTGVESNKMAIGSKLIVHCGERKIYRELFPANGFQGMGPLELIIGVGKAEKIDKLEIRWPNGKQQEFQNVPVNKIISLTEGIESFQTSEFLNLSKRKTEN